MRSDLFVVVLSFEVAREDLEISHAFSLSWGNIPVTASITPGNQWKYYHTFLLKLQIFHPVYI